MATIKSSDTRVLVDDLGSQFVDLLRTGTEAAEPFRVITGSIAQNGIVTGNKISQTVDYPLADSPHVTTYTLTGSNLQDTTLASATKLVDETLETESGYEDGVPYTSSTQYVDTWTTQATPYDPDHLVVTGYSSTVKGTVNSTGDGSTLKATISGSAKFVGLEQYGVNGDGDLVLQTIVIRSAAYTASSSQSGSSWGTKYSGSVVDSVSLLSKSGLTFDTATGGLSGVLDSLTYNYGYSVKGGGYSETYTDSYSATAFTPAMLLALDNAVNNQTNALLKAALLGGDDTITGNSKDGNYLEGGLGNDRITGNTADDMLNGDEGDDQLFGMAGDDVLFGGDGNDVLDGGTGLDWMIGGNGDDTYVLDNHLELGRINTYNADSFTDDGNDTLRITYKGGTSANPSLISMTTNLAEVENLQITGTGVFSVTGNALDNILDAGKTSSTLSGGLGDDTYYVAVKGTTLIENAACGNDTVISSISYVLGANIENLTLIGKAALNGTGNELANGLIGNDGANILDGGAGADKMAGGKGNDIYIVDDVGDVVTEALNAGTDMVKSSVSFTLGDNLENLTLAGLAQDNLSGTGNALKNTLTGDAGNNTLDGRGGVDKLIGGKGDDTYIVDLIAKGAGAKATVALEDSIIEKKGEGTDTLQLRVSQDVLDKLADASKATTLVLGANLENLDASDTEDLWLNLTGNALNNVIRGNAGDNILSGGAGDDTLHAGEGGKNVLIGGAGADIMHGGAGDDTFRFTSLKDLGLGEDKQDVIHGFNEAGVDKLDFSALKGWSFKEDGLITGTKQLWAVQSGGDLILYGNSSGNLDADFSIKLVGVSVLSADDFIV